VDLQQQLDALRLAYLDNVKQQLPQLQQQAGALTVGESASHEQLVVLCDKLHMLAGSAGTFNLPELGQAAKALEHQLKHWLAQPASFTAAALSDFLQQLQTLPQLLTADALPVSQPRSKTHSSSGGGIYVYCTEAGLSQQLSTMLDIFGYRYQWFSQLELLTAAISEHRPDALIIDLDMYSAPSECVQRLLQLQQTQPKPLPVLLISAQDDFHSYLSAVRAGAVGYFVKPLNSTELEARLRQLLASKEREPFKVMLVDDDQMLAQHYALVLRQAGLLVEILSEPALIFDSLKRFHPDVILLDVNMPFCSGPELAQLVRLQQAWLGVPIIYLSSETDSEQQLAALIKAGDDFITKPITDTALKVAVFARAQRARQLAEIMTRDSLTGLLQHAHIKERLALEMLRSERTGLPVAVVMLDIDHFKKVNDNYGHLIGDQVIANLANLLKQQLRKTDLVGRYGGEEFLLVLPDCPQLRAVEVIEQIRQRFAALPFSASGQQFFCTFSAGISQAGNGQVDVFIEQADQALYQAKHGGRNCVKVFTP
jgi:diguanylate cyclase (GGDEF)-like protein